MQGIKQKVWFFYLKDIGYNLSNFFSCLSFDRGESFKEISLLFLVGILSDRKYATFGGDTVNC